MPWGSPVRISQARKLSCLLEEGTGEADDSWLPREMNVCRREQGHSYFPKHDVQVSICDPSSSSSSSC